MKHAALGHGVRICLVTSMAIMLSGCRQERISRTFYAMGGIPVTLTATGPDADDMDRFTGIARNRVEEWESELSMYRPDSAVNRLIVNRNHPVQFSFRGWEALQAARQAEQISDRAFDVTVGPIIKLWKTAAQNNHLPSADEINKAMKITGLEHLHFNEADRTVTAVIPDESDSGGTAESEDSTFLIDVGGIAKGLFAEWISRELREHMTRREFDGLGKLIVDLGGDMYVYSSSEKTPCEIGIRDPFSTDRTALWGTIQVMHGGVVTSGTYERAFEIQGKRYCHIVDPRTGYPIETDLVSVTVIDPSGAMADALATTVFVMGEEKGKALIASRPESELLLIRKDGTHFCTPGILSTLEKF